MRFPLLLSVYNYHVHKSFSCRPHLLLLRERERERGIAHEREKYDRLDNNARIDEPQPQPQPQPQPTNLVLLPLVAAQTATTTTTTCWYNRRTIVAAAATVLIVLTFTLWSDGGASGGGTTIPSAMMPVSCWRRTSRSKQHQPQQHTCDNHCDRCIRFVVVVVTANTTIGQ
jgi:hypothetical protein